VLSYGFGCLKDIHCYEEGGSVAFLGSLSLKLVTVFASSLCNTPQHVQSGTQVS